MTPRAGGSTTGQLRACGFRAYPGARESALVLATHSRRVAQARPRSLAAHRCPAHPASPEATLSELAHVPSQPPRRPRLRRLLRRADCDLPGALRVWGPVASSPTSRTLQRNRPTAACTAQQIVEAFPDDSEEIGAGSRDDLAAGRAVDVRPYPTRWPAPHKGLSDLSHDRHHRSAFMGSAARIEFWPTIAHQPSSKLSNNYTASRLRAWRSTFSLTITETVR